MGGGERREGRGEEQEGRGAWGVGRQGGMFWWGGEYSAGMREVSRDKVECISMHVQQQSRGRFDSGSVQREIGRVRLRDAN